MSQYQLNHCEAKKACKLVNPNSTLAKLNLPGEASGKMLDILQISGIYIKRLSSFKEVYKKLIAGYASTAAHISIDEYNSAAFKNYDSNKWSTWNAGEPNVKSGNCIGATNGKMLLVNCLKELPFVCEV